MHCNLVNHFKQWGVCLFNQEADLCLILAASLQSAMSLGGSPAQKPDCSTVIYGIWEVGPTAMSIGHKSEACGEPRFGLAQLGHAPAMCTSTLLSVFQSTGSLSWNMKTCGRREWEAHAEELQYKERGPGELAHQVKCLPCTCEDWSSEFRCLWQPISRLSLWGQGGRERIPGARCLTRLESVSSGSKGDTLPQYKRWRAMEEDTWR